MSAKKKFTDYETALSRLEEITELLESGEQSLEASIELYTEGLDIAKFCHDKLTEVEKKIKVIVEKNAEFYEEPFETETEA